MTTVGTLSGFQEFLLQPIIQGSAQKLIAPTAGLTVHFTILRLSNSVGANVLKDYALFVRVMCMSISCESIHQFFPHSYNKTTKHIIQKHVNKDIAKMWKTVPEAISRGANIYRLSPKNVIYES